MHAYAKHLIREYDLAPTSIEVFGFIQNLDDSFHKPQPALRLVKLQSKTATRGSRALADIPKLRNVLKRSNSLLTSTFQCLESGAYVAMQWIIAIRDAQKNSRINEKGHQSWSE